MYIIIISPLDFKGCIGHEQCFSIPVHPLSRRTLYNKQLLDEVEHDIMNYQNRGLGYLPKPKAEADNTDTRF